MITKKKKECRPNSDSPVETRTCAYSRKTASVNLIFILMDIMRNQIMTFYSQQDFRKTGNY